MILMVVDRSSNILIEILWEICLAACVLRLGNLLCGIRAGDFGILLKGGVLSRAAVSLGYETPRIKSIDLNSI